MGSPSSRCRLELSSWLVDGCLLGVSSHGRERERASVSSYNVTNLNLRVPLSLTHLSLIIFLETPSPNIATVGVKASVCEFGGSGRHKHSVHNKEERWIWHVWGTKRGLLWLEHTNKEDNGLRWGLRGRWGQEHAGPCRCGTSWGSIHSAKRSC